VLFILTSTHTQRFEQAEKNLTILRKLPADHVYIQWEMQQTRDQIELEERVQGKVNTWELLKELFHSRGHRTRLLLGLILLVSQYLSLTTCQLFTYQSALPSSSRRFRAYRPLITTLHGAW